jgi:hypothetical protein
LGFSKAFHLDILTDEFKKQIAGKGKQNTSKIFLAKYGIYTAATRVLIRNLRQHNGGLMLCRNNFRVKSLLL